MTIATLTDKYVHTKAQGGKMHKDEWITDAGCKWLWVVRRKGGAVTFYAWNQRFSNGARACKRQRLGQWPEMSVATARALANAAFNHGPTLPPNATVRQCLVYLAPTRRFAAQLLKWFYDRHVLNAQVAQLTGQRIMQLHAVDDFEQTESLYLYLCLSECMALLTINISAFEALTTIIGQNEPQLTFRGG